MPIRMTKIKWINSTNPETTNGALKIAGGNANGPASLEDNLVVLTKLNILLPYNLSIVLLGIYSKELKTYVHTKKASCRCL